MNNLKKHSTFFHKKRVLSFKNNKQGMEFTFSTMIGLILVVILVISMMIFLYQRFIVPKKALSDCEFSGGVMVNKQDSCPIEKPYTSLIAQRSTTEKKCCVTYLTG